MTAINYYRLVFQHQDMGLRVFSANEQTEMLACATVFEKGDNVIHAGVGMGLLAAYITALVKPGVMMGLEPQTEIYQMAKANVRVSGEPINILNGALVPIGYEQNSTRLNLKRKNWSQATLCGRSLQNVAVTAFRIDQMVKTEPVFDCLALDIEGAELTMLNDRCLEMFRKVVIEIHRVHDTTGLVELLLYRLESHFHTELKRTRKEDDAIIFAGVRK